MPALLGCQLQVRHDGTVPFSDALAVDHVLGAARVTLSKDLHGYTPSAT